MIIQYLYRLKLTPNRLGKLTVTIFFKNTVIVDILQHFVIFLPEITGINFYHALADHRNLIQKK
jgi:hypothetical protein